MKLAVPIVFLDNQILQLQKFSLAQNVPHVLWLKFLAPNHKSPATIQINMKLWLTYCL